MDRDHRRLGLGDRVGDRGLDRGDDLGRRRSRRPGGGFLRRSAQPAPDTTSTTSELMSKSFVSRSGARAGWRRAWARADLRPHSIISGSARAEQPKVNRKSETGCVHSVVNQVESTSFRRVSRRSRWLIVCRLKQARPARVRRQRVGFERRDSPAQQRRPARAVRRGYRRGRKSQHGLRG